MSAGGIEIPPADVLMKELILQTSEGRSDSLGWKWKEACSHMKQVSDVLGYWLNLLI